MATAMEDAEDAESLFTDVGQVQRELEKFSVNSVDANEIYELLEINSFRIDRVEFVTSHLLVNLGLKNELDENIIDISDESCDQTYVPSPEYDVPEINETIALDLSLPGPNCIVNSPVNENENKETINSNSVSDDSSFGPCTSGSLPKRIPLDNKDNIETSSATVKNIETDAVFVESSTRVGPGNDASYHSDEFLYDVNNNDPNNNTEYEAPVEIENREEIKVPDDIEVEFQDQDEVRCKLLGEARLIHRIVPRQNLEQIYSYLEANLDRKNRLQIVMQEFLKMELSSEVCVVPQSDYNSKDSSCLKKQFQSEQGIDNSVQPSTSFSGITVSETDSSLQMEACTSSNIKVKTNEVRTLCKKEELKALLPCDTVDGADDRDTELGKVAPEIRNSLVDDDKHVSAEVTSSSFSAEENDTEQSDKDYKITSTTHINEVNRMDDNIMVEPDHFYNSSNDGEEFALMHDLVQEPPFSPALHHNGGVENIDKYIQVALSPFESHPNIEKKRKSDSVDDTSPEKKNKRDEGLMLHELSENQEKYKSMLLEIFPHVDPDYLRQQCAMLNSELDLNDLISNMLHNDYPLRQFEETAVIESVDESQPGPSVPVRTEEKIEAQFKTLVAILPNADPTYLREKCEAMAGNEEEMKNFVSDALENKKYPTREEYLKRQEALALQKKYTDQFSIEGFLEIIPDPFKFFNEEKKSDFKILNYAMPYLKARYKKIRQQDIASVLKTNDYNLTKTCDILDNFSGPVRRTRRSEYECKTPAEINLPFLQEVTFIENKKKIKEHLKEKIKKKKKAFKLAKSKGELLECGCCFDNEIMTEDIATCNEGHLFCKECIRKFAEIRIGSGETTFPCLGECVSEFSLKTLQVVLKPSVFSRMLQRKQLEEVKAAGIEDLETCPFCDFASIPPKEDKVFLCLNPDCMRESCRNCKELSHIPLHCDEVEKADEVKVRTYIEDRMTEALVRTCWKCQKKFIKEDGCNKMTCTCGAMMCYICRVPVKDYSHFNGQGGDAYHKCPLYTNNDVIHVNPVREEAKKAKEEMKAKNPNLNLKHDPTKNLPRAVQQNNARHINMGNMGLHIHVPGVNLHLPHNRRRNHDRQMAVQVLAGHVNIRHIFNVPGRYGVNQPGAHVHIEPLPVANQLPPLAPIPQIPLPPNPVIQRNAPRRLRIRGVRVDPILNLPDAVPQHLPVPPDGELIIQQAQIGNPDVIPHPLPELFQE